MHNFPQLLLDCLDHKRAGDGGAKKIKERREKEKKEKEKKTGGEEARMVKKREKEIQGTEDISD